MQHVSQNLGTILVQRLGLGINDRVGFDRDAYVDAAQISGHQADASV